MVCADNYGIEVELLEHRTYKQPETEHIRPSYVSLYNNSTSKEASSKVYIDVAIRMGQNNLQELAEHINSKIEEVLSLLPDQPQIQQEQGDMPKV